MTELSIEHVLMFFLVVFALYYLMGKCDCNKDGFSVGLYSPQPNSCNVNGEDGYCLYCKDAIGMHGIICPGW